MIYFDNAATTLTKPPAVAEAITHALSSFGGAGRGVHKAALAADTAVYQARKHIAQLFDAPSPARVAFTSNATEALNMVIAGLVGEGDHAVTTAASHNSVLRPLFRCEDERGASVSVVPIGSDASLDYGAFDAAFRPDTRLCVVTHASNLTGDVYDIPLMARIAHSHNALFCVDAAQTAGVIDVDMARDGIDILCFTGHKSLYGPQGTGGLALADGIEIPPLVVGGSGVHSFDRTQPSFMPEALEAGTLNAHGIAGLDAGVRYLLDTGTANVRATVDRLTEQFEKGVSAIEGVTVYGGHAGIARCGIVALNIGDLDSAAVSARLNDEFDICTRPGAHCAPLMHEALGTGERGAVRFSFSHFNTNEEVSRGISAVRSIAGELA
jgi:cysteine desulfurase family protein